MGPSAETLRNTTKTEHVLIDYENVQPLSSEWGLLSKHRGYKVRKFFYGPGAGDRI